MGYVEGVGGEEWMLSQVAKRMRHALVGALRQGNSSEIDACCLGARPFSVMSSTYRTFTSFANCFTRLACTILLKLALGNLAR